MSLRHVLFQLESPSAGNEQVQGAGQTLSTQPTRQFETDVRAHAMTEEGEGPRQVRPERGHKLFSQVWQPGERRLAEAAAPPRRLDGPDLDRPRQQLRPLPVDVRHAAGIRKTEEAQARARIGSMTDEPGIRS